MIAIVNISPEGTPLTGINKYQLRINKNVICKFEHNRTHDGLAQCLRDAADAVDRKRISNLTVEEMSEIVNRLHQEIEGDV